MQDAYEGIIALVSNLFNNYGIRSITMDEICNELGISKKTLYTYFTDKKDMIEKVLDFEMSQNALRFKKIKEQGLNAIEEIIEVNKMVLQIVKQYNPAKYHDLKKYYPDLHDKITAKQHERMLLSMKTNLAKGKKEGLYRAELDEDIIAKLYLSLMEGPLTNEIISTEEFTSERFIIESFNYHIHGIASSKGLEVAKKIILKNV